MSGLHRICCCGAPPSCDDCTGCGFASSYIATGINGVMTWNKSQLGTVCLSLCLDYEESNKTSFDVSLTISQPSAWTMTRQGTTSCCYRGSGALNISYTIRIIRYARCCAQEPPVTLVQDETYSGTQAVDACLTVVPICDFATGVCKWEHTLRICNFPIQNIQLMDEIDVDDCIAGLAVGDEPLSRHGLWITGACQQWWSTYEALSTIGSTDRQWRGWVCNETTCGTVCSPIGMSTMANGPFSLALYNEWISEPNNCANPAIFTRIIGSWLDCDSALIKEAQPYWSFDYQSDCCVGEGQGQIGPPIYA